MENFHRDIMVNLGEGV